MAHIYWLTPDLGGTARREGFAHEELHVQRKAQIEAAKDAQLVGIPKWWEKILWVDSG